MGKSFRLRPAGRGKWGGRLRKAAVYVLLLDFGFAYLYPILYMALISLMPTSDLVNPTIKWIPTYLDFDNFREVWQILDYGKSFASTLILAGAASVFQTMCCAMAGYALAKFEVPLKKLWIGALVAVFVVPTSLTLVPQYVLFNNYHLIGSAWSVWLPALLGQGIKSSLFVLVFMQAFSYSKSYDEAAQLDGAGPVTNFFRIALPMVKPTIVLSLLLSFVWYTNETTKAGMYLGGSWTTLSLQLEKFNTLYSAANGPGMGTSVVSINERIQMAATLLTVAPMMLLYLVMQKQFVQGVEASGITGE